LQIVVYLTFFHEETWSNKKRTLKIPH